MISQLKLMPGAEMLPVEVHKTAATQMVAAIFPTARAFFIATWKSRKSKSSKNAEHRLDIY